MTFGPRSLNTNLDRWIHSLYNLSQEIKTITEILKMAFNKNMKKEILDWVLNIFQVTHL